MNEVLTLMFSYFAVFILTMVLVGLLLRGFFGSWLIVKISGGKKLLVIVKGNTRTFARVGIIVGETIRFKTTGKNHKTVIMRSNKVYRFASVDCVNYDEVSNMILNPDYTGEPNPLDPEKMDSIIQRAMYQPLIYDNKEKIILLLLIILVVGMIVLGYLQYQSYEVIRTLSTINPVPVV